MSEILKVENMCCNNFECGYRTNFDKVVSYEEIYDQVHADGGAIYTSSSICPWCRKSSLELVYEFINSLS